MDRNGRSSPYFSDIFQSHAALAFSHPFSYATSPASSEHCAGNAKRNVQFENCQLAEIWPTWEIHVVENITFLTEQFHNTIVPAMCFANMGITLSLASCPNTGHSRHKMSIRTWFPLYAWPTGELRFSRRWSREHGMPYRKC